MPILSVIIPVPDTDADSVRALHGTVSSVLRQSLSDIEVLCVIAADVSDYADSADCAADSRLRMISCPGEDLTADQLRDAGLTAACGTFVQFTDPGDLLLDYALEALCHKADKYQTDILRCAVLNAQIPEPAAAGTPADSASAAAGTAAVPDLSGLTFYNIPEDSLSYLRVGDFNRLLDHPKDLPRIAQMSDTPSAALYRRDFLTEHGLSFIACGASGSGDIFHAAADAGGRLMAARDRLLIRFGDFLNPSSDAAAYKKIRICRPAPAHPQVTVIMPVCNVEDFLNQAMTCAVSQSMKDLEILCVNDGSTDGSLTILHEYAALDHRIRILDGPNGGYGKAMNRGIDEARGKYIGIYEPDDYIPGNMYRELYDAAEVYDAEVVRAGYYRFRILPDGSMNLKITFQSKYEKYYNRVLCPADEQRVFRFPMLNWTGIYRRDFLNQYQIRHNETPGASYQDNGFWFQVFCSVRRLVYLHQPFYHYRIDNAGSSVYSCEKLYCMTEEYRFILDYLQREPARFETFKSIYYAHKFKVFIEAYRLRAVGHRREFLHHIRDEFREPLAQGLLCEESMKTRVHWQQLCEIVADPDAYYEHICVSVIIPVYNAAPYLHEMLDSILQSYELQYEVICVDDGSTDESLSILREYETDERVRVYTQPNKGAGPARNLGMQYARGEYLAFLDADDFFEPDMLRKAYENAHLLGTDITVFRSDEYYEDTDEYFPIQYTIRKSLLPDHQPFAGTEIEKNIFRSLMGWPWDKLFRADFVRENHLQFQPLRTTNDLLFVYSAIVKAQKISTMDSLLAHHRKTDSSLSVTREKSWGCFYEALTALRTQLKDWDLYDRFEQDYINYALHFSLWHLDTLKGDAYISLYEALKTSWFADLGILSNNADYFYEAGDYAQLQLILEEDAYTHLFRSAARYRSRITRLNGLLQDAKEQKKNQKTEYEEQLKQLRSANAQLRIQNRRLAASVEKVNTENRQLKTTWAWKIGRAITRIPGRIRRLLRRL